MNFRVDVIKPGKTLEIPIIFYPRETISYRELIPFEINGLSQQVVEIRGKGTEMKVSDSWGGHRAWHHPPCPSQPPCPPEPTLLQLHVSCPLAALSEVSQSHQDRSDPREPHRSRQYQMFLYQRTQVTTGTAETFFFLEKFETIRCSIPSKSSSSHMRARTVFRLQSRFV